MPNFEKVLSPDSKYHKALLSAFDTRFHYARDAVVTRAEGWKATDKLVRSKLNPAALEAFLDALDKGKHILEKSLALTYRLSTSYTIERKLRSIVYETLKVEPFRLSTYAGLTQNSREVQEHLEDSANKSGFRVVLRNLTKDAIRYGRAACLCSYARDESTIASTEGSNLIDFEGSLMSKISPYDFFPDPSVPIKDVSTRAEYIFTRGVRQRHLLSRSSTIVHMDKLETTPGFERLDGSTYINQMVDSVEGGKEGQSKNIANQLLIDVAYWWIKPREYGLIDEEEEQIFKASPLKPSEQPRELWQIWRANEQQIIYAQRVTDSPDRIPIVATEPYGEGELLVSDITAPFQCAIDQQLNVLVKNRVDAVKSRLIVNRDVFSEQDFESGKPVIFCKINNETKLQDAIFPIDVQLTTQDTLNVILTLRQLAAESAGINETIQGKTPDPRTPATTANIAAQQSVDTIISIADAMRIELIEPLSRIMIFRITTGVVSNENFVRINNKQRVDVLTNNKVDPPVPITLGSLRFPLAQENVGKDRAGTAQALQSMLPIILPAMDQGFLQDTRTEIIQEILSALGLQNVRELIRRGDDAESAQKIAATAAVAAKINESTGVIPAAQQGGAPSGGGGASPSGPPPQSSGTPGTTGTQSAGGAGGLDLASILGQ